MPLLNARELRAGYGSLEVLHGVDFYTDTGELVVVMGPNGAGKSTLLGSLARAVRTFSGEITFKGESILSLRTSDVARNGMAFVPQDGNVFTDLSVRENLTLAASASGSSRRALHSGGFADSVFDHFPFLRKLENRPAGLLSGGERQALALSMGFLQRPSIMLLDEPTAGLSPLAAENLGAWILELAAQGLAIVWVVEQDPEVVLKVATRAYLLDGGYVRFSGDAQELVGGKGAELLFQPQQVFQPQRIATTEGTVQ